MLRLSYKIPPLLAAKPQGLATHRTYRQLVKYVPAGKLDMEQLTPLQVDAMIRQTLNG
jgi:hypothetical protein